MTTKRFRSWGTLPGVFLLLINPLIALTIEVGGTGGPLISAGEEWHLTVSACNVQGGQGRASVSAHSTLTWGAGNIDREPEFPEEARGDFRLRFTAGWWDAAARSWIADATTSPCIDSGAEVREVFPEIAAWLERDFDGIARPLDGDGNVSPGIDIGAHEVVTERADSRGDGMADGWVFRHGLNAANPDLARGDPDGDHYTPHGVPRAAVVQESRNLDSSPAGIASSGLKNSAFPATNFFCLASQ